MSATEGSRVVVLVGRIGKGQEEPWRKAKVVPRGHGWTNKHQLIHKQQTSRLQSRATVNNSTATARHSARAPLTTIDVQHETSCSPRNPEATETNKPVTPQLLKSTLKWGTQSKKESRGEERPRSQKATLNLPWLESGCYSSLETKPGMKAWGC